MIEIHVPHGSPMGSKSGIGASTITEVQILNIFVHLRDVGVITWFVFHISNFYKFTQWNLCCISKSRYDEASAKFGITFM